MSSNSVIETQNKQIKKVVEPVNNFKRFEFHINQTKNSNVFKNQISYNNSKNISNLYHQYNYNLYNNNNNNQYMYSNNCGWC